MRKNEFLRNWQIIQNQDLNSSFRLKFNHMTDWTQDEYNQILGLHYHSSADNNQINSYSFIEHIRSIFNEKNNDSQNTNA